MKSSNTRAKATGTPILVRVQPANLSLLDQWRKEQDDLPSRPEAIRRLVDEALALHKKS